MVAESGLLNYSVLPHSHTQPGLAPDLEVWGQPSNQIQTTVRGSLIEEARKTRKQRVKRPQRNKKPQKTLKDMP